MISPCAAKTESASAIIPKIDFLIVSLVGPILRFLRRKVNRFFTTSSVNSPSLAWQGFRCKPMIATDERLGHGSAPRLEHALGGSHAGGYLDVGYLELRGALAG